MTRWIAERLESGAWATAPSRALGVAWGRIASTAIARPLVRPPRARIVAVGGGTLGGSGKTPVAIAVAAMLAQSGVRVAFVGHAYASHPGRARVVQIDDALDEVGDEALLASRALAPVGVRVVVAPTRQAAVDHAATHADVIVLDGPLQLRPRRAALSLLAVDAAAPWGAGRSPPAGDLRAPRAALLAASDRVVVVCDQLGERRADATLGERAIVATMRLGDVTMAGGSRVPLADLRGARVGLLAGLARPERVLAALARRGIVPVAVHAFADHRPLGPGGHDAARRLAVAAGITVWLATEKCELRLPAGLGAPLGTLSHRVDLPPSALDEIRRALGFPDARAVVDCAPCEPPAGANSPSSSPLA